MIKWREHRAANGVLFLRLFNRKVCEKDISRDLISVSEKNFGISARKGEVMRLI